MDKIVPQMHAEAGYEVIDNPPMRISGFICLLLGLLSAVSVFGQPMLVIPIGAILMGLLALRRSSSDDVKPVGTTPAKIGLVLAVGFGACGLFLPLFKTLTLGREAELFSRYYMEVLARGEDQFAMELSKEYFNRLPKTMSMKEYYAISEAGSRAWEEFREQDINEQLRRRGPDAEWVLYQPVRVFYSYGRDHAEVIWEDPTGEFKAKVQLFLEYTIDSKGNGQWHVKHCQNYSERITAPGIL